MKPQNEAPYRHVVDVELGRDVKVYGFTNLYGCKIGDETQVGAFVEIQKGAVVGKRCKISSHAFICEGVTIEDECFVGHGVIFVNDKRPKACKPDGTMVRDGDWTCVTTTVKRGATIGSGAVVMCGITIGENSTVGAGAVVTKDIAANMTVAGNPAKPL